jgi:hypothetical protein
MAQGKEQGKNYLLLKEPWTRIGNMIFDNVNIPNYGSTN